VLAGPPEATGTPQRHPIAATAPAQLLGASPVAELHDVIYHSLDIIGRPVELPTMRCFVPDDSLNTDPVLQVGINRVGFT